MTFEEAFYWLMDGLRRLLLRVRYDSKSIGSS